ncbi:hypothetical protein MTP99_015850 [Tenebrio molitor]|nr:hypothetical protein MTP99_015850 [Tenebrio molitor]
MADIYYPLLLNSPEDSEEDDAEVRVHHIPKRYIRDALNPLEFYRDVEFKRRYRFSKDAVLHGILPLIQNALAKNNNRGLPVQPVMQLLLCLRFFATASFQTVVGDLMSLSQPTVSRVVFRVSTLLASLMHEHVRMPRSNEAVAENRRLFRALGVRGRQVVGLPGIDGAIDCTHVRLTNTVFQRHAEVYRNRKGYFSFNVQAVVGPRMEFMDIVPEWAGRILAARIKLQRLVNEVKALLPASPAEKEIMSFKNCGRIPSIPGAEPF